MYISRQHHFLFCHVPRTGGTVFSEHIRNHVKDAERLHLQHLSMQEAKALLLDEFDSLFKFAFVRNPWDKLVSWYALLALNKVDYDEESRDLQISPDSPHWQKFDEFLEKACKHKVNRFRGDWLEHSQWLQLIDENGELLVDEIGRYENYAHDVERFLLKMKVSAPFVDNLNGARNGSRHLHYSQYYSDYGKELVAEVFADDILNFNYQFERV